MTSKKFVIGGGIVGLIAGYLKNAVVISKSFGMNQYAPVWLHCHKVTEKFLQELGINPATTTINIRVFDGDKVREVMPGDREKYSMKVWGTVENHVMAEGKKHIEVFDYPVTKLYNLLLKKVQCIQGEVVGIDTNLQVIWVDTGDGLRSFSYSELISTIPLNILCEILGIEDYQFEYKTIYGTVTLANRAKVQPQKNEIIYDVSDSIFYRHTCPKPGLVLSESVVAGDIVVGWKIKNKIGLKELDGIKLVGRYARWIPKYYIHDALKDLGVI